MTLSSNQYIIVLISIITLLSCGGKKNIIENTADDSYQVELSATSKLFLNDLEVTDDEKPSKEFIEKYPIKLIEDTYYVQGIITQNETLKPSNLAELGIKSSTSIGDKTNVLVPLKSFKQLLRLEQISYFEIASKGELK